MQVPSAVRTLSALVKRIPALRTADEDSQDALSAVAEAASTVAEALELRTDAETLAVRQRTIKQRKIKSKTEAQKDA